MGQRIERTMAAASELIWECVKTNNSFIRKSRCSPGVPVLSADRGNLCGLNSFKYSGLANKNVLDVAPKLTGKKEAIVMTTRNKKDGKAFQPKRMILDTGLKKQSKKGLAAVAKVMDAGYYRRDLLDLATTKYAKVKRSFKKKKVVV